MSESSEKRGLGWLRDLAIFLALAWGILWWQSKDMLTEGVAIAPMTLVTLSGEVATLEPAANKKTLIYFFAPWCSICKASIGNLDALDQTSVQIYVVALDYESTNAVQAFVDEVGLSLPVYLGTAETGAQFKIQGYPSYYVLDEGFNIVSRSVGYSTEMGLKWRL